MANQSVSASDVDPELLAITADGYAPFRIAFSLTTLLLGLYIVYRVSHQFYELWTQRKRSSIISILFLVFIFNLIVHSIHYSDNMVRPEKYFELKVFYRKYLISTMELKFCANILVMVVGWKAAASLITSMVTGEQDKINKHTLCLLAYLTVSLLTMASYLMEAPVSYELIPNLLISSESVSALLLAVVLLRVYWLNSKALFGGPEKDLAKLLSYNNNSEDEEVVTFSRVEVHNQTQK